MTNQHSNSILLGGAISFRQLFVILSLFLAGALQGQIFEPEGINMPGTYDGFANPPNVNAIKSVNNGGDIDVDNTGQRRYHTKIAVPGDLAAGTYSWLFTSGPSVNYFANKWADVTVITDALQTYTIGGLTDNSVTLNNGYYTVNWEDMLAPPIFGYTDTRAIWMYTSAQPVTIDAVAASPLGTGGTVAATGQDVTVTVTTSALLSTEEKIYLRYSTDGFASSTLVEVTGFLAIPVGTAVIPGMAAGTNLSYYVFSTTVNSPSADYDLQTINYNNNSGSNYSYTVSDPVANTAGNWNTTGTWNTGQVPASGAGVTIDAAITLDVAAEVSSLTINGGGSLDNGSQDLRIAGGGTLTNNGSYTGSTGKVIFDGGGTVSGTISFYNVDISGGVDFGSNSTVTNTLAILAGGFVNTNAPAYGASSTLQYNTGGAYNAGSEWQNTPVNVLVSGSTALTLNVTGGSGYSTGGDFTVEGSASLDLDVPTSPLASFFALTVGGDLITSSTGAISISDGDGNDDKPSCATGCYDVRIVGDVNVGTGTSLTLNGNRGDDFYVQGNMLLDGTFEPNKRAIYFEGSTAQNYTDNANTMLDFVVVDNSAGVTSVNDMRLDSIMILTTGGLQFGVGDTLRMTPSGRINVSSGWINGATRQKRFLSGSSIESIAYNLTINPNGNTLDSVLAITTSGAEGIISTDFGAGDIREGVGINWIIRPETQPSSDVTVTFSWNSAQHTNSKDLADIFCWKQEDGSSIWERQNASPFDLSALPTPTETLGFSSFSTFTFSDGPSPLPVDLVEFTGTPNQAGVQLNWLTATELHNDFFEVAKSSNGVQFEEVAVVDGQGTTTRVSEYALLDPSPYKGINYYRLTQVDFSGVRSESDLIAVEYWPAGQLAAFPSPFQSVLNISWQGLIDEVVTISLVDLSGRLHFSEERESLSGANQVSLRVPDVPPGTYTLVIRDQAGNLFSRIPVVRK